MNHEQNPRGGESRGTGNFKLNIDERDLATGSIDVQERRGQPPRPEYSANKAFLTDKERRQEEKAHKKRDRRKARKNRRVFSLVWLCMVLLVSFTLASYLITGSNDFFAVGRSEGTTEVTIPENVTIDELTQIVYDAGAIKEPEFFQLFCNVTVDEEELGWFQPGVYQLETNMDYQDIISTLQGGNETREVVTVTFPEGMTVLQVAALLGFGGHVACGAKAGPGGYFFALGHGNFFQPAVAPHAILRVGHFHHAAPQSVIRNGGHGTGGHRRYLFGGIIRAVVGAPVPQGGVIHQRIPAERLAGFTVPASARQGSLLRGRSSRAASPAGGAARLPSPLLQG